MVKVPRRIPVSNTVFKYLNNDVKEKFLEKHTGYDGKSVSYEQLMRSMIKVYCDLLRLQEENGTEYNDK